MDILLSYDEKQKLKRKALDKGVSASELIRRFIATLCLLAIIIGVWYVVSGSENAVVAPARALDNTCSNNC